MPTQTIQDFIKAKGMMRHPEGGCFLETYRDPATADFGDGFESKTRSLSTSIYFLLQHEEQSALHVLKANEVWSYHAGCAMRITMIDPATKAIKQVVIGNPLEGYEPQTTVPKGMWFGATPVDSSSFSLCGCHVAPGFDFRDFALISEAELMALIPAPSSEILNLIHTEVEVNAEVSIPVAVVKAWKQLRQFDLIPNSMKGVTSVECAGEPTQASCLRTITTVAGATIKEELKAVNHEAMSIGYAVVETPSLLSNCHLTLAVAGDSENTVVTIKGQFGCQIKHKEQLLQEVMHNFQDQVAAITSLCIAPQRPRSPFSEALGGSTEVKTEEPSGDTPSL